MYEYQDPDLQPHERVAIFDKLHGKNPMSVGGWYIYADGAKRDRHPMGQLLEPPANRIERYENIIRYLEAKLALQVRQFDELKQQLLDDLNGWTEASTNTERLARERQIVRQTQNELNDARAKYAEHNPRYVLPEEAKRRAQIKAATAARRSEYRKAISEIEV